MYLNVCDLKVGDEVGVQVPRDGCTISTVTKKTPSGQITLATGMRFKKNGCEVGKTWRFSSSLCSTATATARIEAATAQAQRNTAFYTFRKAVESVVEGKRRDYNYVENLTEEEKTLLKDLIDKL